MVSKFFNRLLKSNYNKDLVKSEIIKTISSFNNTKVSTYNLPKIEDKLLIIKATYFTNLKRNKLRQLALKHLPVTKETSNLCYNKLIIALKRRKNLKEILFPSKLHIPTNLHINSIRKDPYELYYLPAPKLHKF